jgi:thioredoxin
VAEPIAVSDATFAETVLGAGTPVLVDFWAAWCAPCRIIRPVVEQLARELEGRLTVVTVDIDENVGAAGDHAIFSIPTLVLFKDGREVERFVGSRRMDELAARLAPYL